MGIAINWRVVERIIDYLALSMYCLVLFLIDKYRIYVKEKERLF